MEMVFQWSRDKVLTVEAFGPVDILWNEKCGKNLH